jgi:hypothetical protein
VTARGEEPTLHDGAPPGPAVWRVGSILDGYRLLDVLGRGGMGIVYLAEDTRSGTRYALKALLEGASERVVERFRREGIAQARVDAHPNVVRVRSSGEALGRPYLVMDLATGGDLAGRLREGPLEPAVAARVVAELARGLAHVNRQGILHRDLKPSNVLFAEGDTPRLVDFGVARIDDAERLTRTGCFLGTPAYASPEQASGEPVDARSDVYGLGAVLYHALTGQPPFAGDSPLSTIHAVLTTPPAPVRSLRPEVSPALAAVVERALAKDRDDRYATGDDLAVALEEAARPAIASSRGPVAVMTVALALVVLAVILVVVAPWRPVEDAPREAQGSSPAPPAAPVSPSPGARPTAVEPSTLWIVEPGRAVDYRLRWTELNQSGAQVTLSFVLHLARRPGPDDDFDADMTDEQFDLSVPEVHPNSQGGWLRRATFRVAVDRAAGTIVARGHEAMAQATFDRLPDELKLGMNISTGAFDQPSGPNLGVTLRRLLIADGAFSSILQSTLGAGFAGPPWKQALTRGERGSVDLTLEAHGPRPLLPLAITDVGPGPEALGFSGHAVYRAGLLEAASLRQTTPTSRLNLARTFSNDDRPPDAHVLVEAERVR